MGKSNMREVRKKLGIKPVKEKVTKISGSQIRKILEFATANKFVISPVGYKYFVDSFNLFRCCPCDKTRLECPCPQATEEVTELGKCRCQLFWRDYNTYLEEKIN